MVLKTNLASKRNRTQMKLNYYQGLAFEFNKTLNNYKVDKLKTIDRYFDEDTKIINERLSGIHENTDKQKVLLKVYDKKAYWKRRRFKKVNEKAENLELLLKDYDANALKDKAAYIEVLNDKYPVTKYSADDIKIFEAKLQIQKDIRQKRIIKMEENFKKLQEKTRKALENLNVKQENLKQVIDNLTIQIKEHNASLLIKDQESLKVIDEKLQSDKLLEKQKDKLLETKLMIENKILINDHLDIQLSVSGLKMFFGGIKAVNDLSFDVKRGEVFGLIGPNGAGKTTVFNCITQFYKPSGGSIYFRNKVDDIVDLAKLQTHDMIHQGIARSFQNVELIWELTVLDNLLVAAHSLLLTDYLEHMVHSKKMLREEQVLRTKGYQILKDLGIEAYAFRSPYGLPYGVLKKVELARTLMTNPTMIILDEPAAGLNDQETLEIAAVIKDINKKYGITIFLVEHDMGLVMSICDRVCAISFGRKLALDVPKAIQQNHDVRVAYLGEADDE